MLLNKYQDLSQIAMLKFMATKLEELNEKVVYVGGCTTALFITDPLSLKIRTTKDVDCVIDLLLGEYHHTMKNTLREKGFKESMEDDITCRWRYDEMIIDIMPVNEKILGFSNYWFKDTMKYAVTQQLADNITIKVAAPPYFIATKMEAFKTRGANDFMSSHDLEDIITVIEGRPEIIDEILSAELTVKEYIQKTLVGWINSNQFQLALPGHVNDNVLAREKAVIILKCLKKIAGID